MPRYYFTKDNKCFGHTPDRGWMEFDSDDEYLEYWRENYTSLYGNN